MNNPNAHLNALYGGGMQGQFGASPPMPPGVPAPSSGVFPAAPLPGIGGGPVSPYGAPAQSTVGAAAQGAVASMGPPGVVASGMMGQRPSIGQNGFGVHPDATHEELAKYVMQALGNHESRNNYTAQNPNSTASGKYQYINGTWNHFGGYSRAKDAPPEVQEARMRQDTTAALHRFGGDPFKVVANHYYPRYAGDPSQWTSPIKDKYGKEIPGAGTVADYLKKVLPGDRVDKYLAGAQPAQQGTGMGSI